MNLSRESSELAPLQTLHPDAFMGDSKVPQDMCNFVLALALIYNDCKDGLFSNRLLVDSRPTGEPKIPNRGATTVASSIIF